MKGETYEEFVAKFKPKKTTDDCYTPQPIMNIIFDYVEKQTGVDRSHFVRPFYPGGDYEHYNYKPDDIVVDNPPFSFLAKILDFYIERGIKFFLFAPALTIFNSMRKRDVCGIIIDKTITYENGANVSTSFITNLDKKNRVIASAYLQRRINEVQKPKKERPKYKYPKNVLTVSDLKTLAKAGISYSIPQSETYFIESLDNQKKNKKGIYGGGYLISDKEAEKKEAEKKKAEKKEYIWELSDREKQIIENLNRKEIKQ